MKKVLAFTLAMGMMLIQGSAFAIDASLTGTGGGVRVDGLNTNHATVNTNTINGSVGTTDWTRFNIGKGETVTNKFNAQNQQLLFRVIGDPTKINGTWNTAGVGAASGVTTLINPAGVMVGSGGVINLGSLNIDTRDQINNKIGNVNFAKGATIGTSNLDVNAGSIYSAANLIGYNDNGELKSIKSIKLSTVDGINYDVAPGVDTGTAKGNIYITNTAIKNPDGTIVIKAGKNANLENFKVTGGETYISTTTGDVNIQAGLNSEGKLDMGKRSKFEGGKVYIDSKAGNIYLENLDNVNGSKLVVSNQTGLIESSNNVNSGNSSYAVSNQKGDIHTTDLHNKNSQYVAKNRTGKIDIQADNDNAVIGLYSNTGDINIVGTNNRNGSKIIAAAPDHNYLTPPDYVKTEPSNINVIGSTNDATSKMMFYNDKGNVTVTGVTNDGSLYFNVKEGLVNITNSNLNGSIQNSKADRFHFKNTKIDKNATIGELDGAVEFYHVTSNGTVNLNNKNGDVLITGSTFANDLNVNSTDSIQIATTKAQNINAKAGVDVTIYDLTKDINANNIEAGRDAVLLGSDVKFKSVKAGRDATLASYPTGGILTDAAGGDITAGRTTTVITGTQDIILNKVEGNTLHTTFTDDNKVRIHGGQKIVLDTSANNAVKFERTIDDTANNREFELRGGQFDYAPNEVALKTGVITLAGKRSDLNVKDGVSNADTIDINAFDSDNLNIKTTNGNIYVYEPITRPGMDYEAIKVGTAVYHIWPGTNGGDDGLQDLIDNQEINKLKDIGSDIAALAPSPMIDFIPLGASAEIDEINKKYFIEVTKDNEYEVLQNLPIGTQDPSLKKREIY